MNILQRYIGIISYKLPGKLPLGNYKASIGNEVYNLIFDTEVADYKGSVEYQIATKGFVEKTGQECWMTFMVRKDNNEVSQGFVQTLDGNIHNELKFYSPREVNRTFHNWDDENGNMLGRYSYDFERFNVPFSFERCEIKSHL